MNDEEDKTPTETPSAMHKMGLAVCPKCEGARFFENAQCPMCGGGGRVTLTEFNTYVGLKRTDPAPPETE